MELKPSIQGVIFDMDGVLCDSEPLIAEAAVQMFAEQHALTVTPDDFLPFVGTGEDRFLGGVADKYGITLQFPADKDRTYAIYLEIIRGRLHPLPGVAEFIAACRRQRLKLAIATSADRVKLDGNLREIGLSADMFDACVTGNEVRRKKPAPDIFLAAARKARMAPDAALVIEDAPNGIQAAQAAGMRALGITSSFNAAVLMAAGADWTAPDLAHVPEGVWGDGVDGGLPADLSADLSGVGFAKTEAFQAKGKGPGAKAGRMIGKNVNKARTSNSPAPERFGGQAVKRPPPNV